MIDTNTILTVSMVLVGGAMACLLVFAPNRKSKALAKIQNIEVEIPKEENVRETDIPVNEAPKKFPFELVRKVEGNGKPLVIKRKMVKNTDQVIDFKNMKPLARTYFIRSVIRRDIQNKGFLGKKKTEVSYVARCNEYWSESLDSLDQDIPKFSQELSNLLLADDDKQHIDGVVQLQKFILDATIMKLIVVVLGMSIPFGLFMIELLHLVPAQIVIWSP